MSDLNLFPNQKRIEEILELREKFLEGVIWANQHFEEMTPELEERFEKKLELPLDEKWEKIPMHLKEKMINEKLI